MMSANANFADRQVMVAVVPTAPTGNTVMGLAQTSAFGAVRPAMDLAVRIARQENTRNKDVKKIFFILAIK